MLVDKEGAIRSSTTKKPIKEQKDLPSESCQITETNSSSLSETNQVEN